MSRLLTGLAAAALAAAPALFEVPHRSLPALWRAPVELVGEVERADGSRDGRTTNWSFVLRVEKRVCGGEHVPGERVVVRAFTRTPAPGTADTRGHVGSFAGVNGLPERGDRVRVYADVGPDGLVAVLPNGLQPVSPLVAFVAADDEYRSETSMPLVAALLEGATDTRTHVIVAADPATGAPDVRSKTANTGLVRLDEAHVAVLFLRYSRDERLAHALETFTRDGRPVVGFRTSTHAFAFGDDSPRGALDDGFGERVFGTPWRRHHGHGTGTRLLPPEGEAAEHPILRGTADDLAARPLVPSWLYVVEPLPADCTVLLFGETADPAAAEDPQRRQPVLWVRESTAEGAPRRMAYTSLGHPGDFEHPVVRRLALQMVAWALGDDDALPLTLPAAPTSWRSD